MDGPRPYSPREAERIVAAWGDMLLRVAMHLVGNRAEAEDVVQTAFLRLVQARPAFESEEHERAWLIRVTRNLCKDYHKSAWKRRVTPAEELPPPPPAPPEYEMLSLVRLLPENQRTAIYLYYYENMPVAEIARALNAKESTVMSWLHRGRVRLKEMLKEEF